MTVKSEQAPAPAAAPKSLAEVNSAFLQARTDRLSGALTAALAGKLDPPGPPVRMRKPSASAPSSSTPAVVATVAATDPSATPKPSETEEAAPEFPEEPAEAEEAPSSLELAELQELGKKRDLRALEKKLGLEEGTLGVNNASWKAYRKRVDEVTARESKHATDQDTLISKFSPAVGLIQRAQKGDLRAYAQLLEHTTGVPVAKFVSHWSKNIEQLDPRIAELEQENARLKSTAPQAETQPLAPAAAIAKTDAYLSAEAKDHPAWKLDGAKEGIRQLWLASFQKATKTFALSPKAAATEFLRVKKATHEREQWILAGKTPPAKKKTTTITRTGASESQPRQNNKNLTRQQLIDRAASEWQRAKNKGK